MSRDFPGATTDYLSLGDVAALDITGTALTLAAWIRPDAVVSRAIIAKYDNAGTQATKQYMLDLGSGSVIVMRVDDGAGEDVAVGTTVLTAGSWYAVAGVKNGTGADALKVYLNGTQEASATSNRTIQNTATGVTIGRYADAGGAFDGRIAEAGVWNVALTAAEIAALAKGVSPLLVHPGNLKGYWPIWGIASPEADLSGNANNPTINGSLPVADHAPVGPYASLGG